MLSPYTVVPSPAAITTSTAATTTGMLGELVHIPLCIPTHHPPPLRTAASLFLFCLCTAAGCGGYRYRRYHVVRTYAPLNAAATTTVVTSANTSKLSGEILYLASLIMLDLDNGTVS